MGSVVKFAAVNTKVRALEGKLLNKTQIQGLIQCNSYKDALLYLRNETDYGQALKGYNLDEIHRGQLEIILKKYYIEDFTKLVHYFTGNYKKLFNILFMRFEIEDLKVIIRGKYIGKESEEIYPFITYESPLNYINYKELIAAKGLEDLVDKLKDTVYYKHIAHLVKTVKEEGLFRIEMTLDFVYLLSLRKFLTKVSREDRGIINVVNGTYADLLNIQWIFRGKKYYKLTPEVLLNYTIYDGYKLNRDDIKNLCYADSMEEFYGMVFKLPYGRLFEKVNYTEYLLEKEILAYLKNIHEKYKRAHEMNISVVIAYLELALLECRDIISILENKRYNIPSNDTLRYITATI